MPAEIPTLTKRTLHDAPRHCTLPEQCLGHPLINLERGSAVLLCGIERLQPQVRLKGGEERVGGTGGNVRLYGKK